MIRHEQVASLDKDYINKKLEQFFIEDNIFDDITTISTQNKNNQTEAVFLAKEDLLFVGKQIILQGFKKCVFKHAAEDGTYLKKGSQIAVLSGPIVEILKKERVILNLIQRLSGIASTTQKLVKKTEKFGIQLLDTRKTTPGLRRFEKYAVFVGGGTNHRYSLKDSVMIKDNHLIGNSSFQESVDKAFAKNPNKDIQVEVDSSKQLREVLKTKATSILLDNFHPKSINQAIGMIKEKKKKIYIELSGGINMSNIDSYCIDGVDGISMGALTHNIKSKDISLDLK
ncbi:MAG: nicotinate-nucleotide diphosphorylase (carboxylating) [Candidatus Marinimicrobia bacterium]|nr:nicotinate-nucleotide diphosphorylase (carboxylating) [Candidatus Neomarinimicrobiota bacterium]|tara:strand:+ start:7180 stop:8031 length:852 start_codon:yes stop_codon:yes gene_type:complete